MINLCGQHYFVCTVNYHTNESISDISDFGAARGVFAAPSGQFSVTLNRNCIFQTHAIITSNKCHQITQG